MIELVYRRAQTHYCLIHVISLHPVELLVYLPHDTLDVWIEKGLYLFPIQSLLDSYSYETILRAKIP